MQKFHKGDLVRVAKDLGPGMSHFTADCDAIVIGSYKDQYGGTDTNNYTLHLKGKGQTSWYYEDQLTLLEHNRLDLLQTWEEEAEAERKMKADLDWIFANGTDVLAAAHGATVQALADCFGLSNLWGNRGEGYVYYQNAMLTLQLAKPFLESGDKAGWLAFAETLKQSKG